MTSRVESFLWDAFAHASSYNGGGSAYDTDSEHSDNVEYSYDVGHPSNNNIPSYVPFARRGLSGGEEADDHGGDDEHGGGGVHISYDDLYASIMFFACIYIGGQIAARFLKMPSLVGEIFAGILLGPNLADYVPNPTAFVMLGEIGLILLVIEAGIDIDLTTLKLIGTRGLIIAIVGSVLPIVLAMAIAFAIGADTTAAIAAGASFGPTSLGIAMNILRQGKIVNTPVGQLIISAAVIDDMIALIILSQLPALMGDGDVEAAQIIIPIVSALGFLVIGGLIAVTVLPQFLDKHFFPRIAEANRGAAGLGVMFLLLFGMMPATYYAKASFLMGAFVSGLVFCRNHAVHVRFVGQFKRILQWLMRVFFAASIGFQVPIKDFADGKVIGYGLLFTLALIGKLAVGFLVPNFNNTAKFKGLHLRDCFVTGFSMAAEGEFAFVIAVFAVDNGLIDADLYASIVLAVLISTIVPPFALRFTIGYYNKVAEELIKKAEGNEIQRAASIDPSVDMKLSPEEREKALREQIMGNKIVYMCIQIQSASTWGLIPKMISTLSKLKLEVIDNRSWHPRGVDSTLMTEIFVEDDGFLADLEKSVDDTAISTRLEEVSDTMKTAIRQPGAKVKVTRWFPGVLREIVEETTQRQKSTTEVRHTRGSVRELLAKEAVTTLESKRNAQLDATKEKSAAEIRGERGEVSTPEVLDMPGAKNGVEGLSGVGGEKKAPPRVRRRVRQKMRSTPVVGGSLFDDFKGAASTTTDESDDDASAKGTEGKAKMDPFSTNKDGERAELVVNGESFNIRLTPQTLNRIRSGYSGGLLDDASVTVASMDVPVEHRLQGFVRTGLPSIMEDLNSETGSNHQSELDEGW